MSLIMDLLSGRLFKFRLASASDINQGTSDKMLITPKGLADSQLFTVASVPFVMSAPFVVTSTNWTVAPYQALIPTWGTDYLFIRRANQFTARFFINCITDWNCAGEVTLWDIAANAPVGGSSIFVGQNSWMILPASLFYLNAGKVYSFAIRKTIPSSTGNITVASALLTMQIPKA